MSHGITVRNMQKGLPKVTGATQWVPCACGCGMKVDGKKYVNEYHCRRAQSRKLYLRRIGRPLRNPKQRVRDKVLSSLREDDRQRKRAKELAELRKDQPQ